jgi:hypothetical protein
VGNRHQVLADLPRWKEDFIVHHAHLARVLRGEVLDQAAIEQDQADNEP